MNDHSPNLFKAVAPIPQGYTSVTPWIISADTRALIALLKRAFDAHELGLMENPDGTIGHAEIRVGNAIVMAFDAPKGSAPTPAHLRLYVDDADRSFRQAVEAGAQTVTKVTMLAFGDRVGRVRDPLGNLWWIQQRIEEVGADEMNRRWTDPKWTKAMEYVQNSLAEALKR